MNFYRPYPWYLYSKKLSQKINRPHFARFFTPEDAREKGVRLVIGRSGAPGDEYQIALYWLVRQEDGVIVDVGYQVVGPSVLIGALEAASQLLLQKNYDQARQITIDLIEKEVKDQAGEEAIPPELESYVALVVEVIQDASLQCMDIPIDETKIASPISPEMLTGDGIEGWEHFPYEKKLSIIEHVIQEDIRPYIELDAGGIQIVRLSDSHELTIAYQGSCTSCHSATGSTLQAIQQILQAKVSPLIQVVPDLSLLTTSHDHLQ